MADGVSKCGRKTALAVFFTISLIAFLFSLLSLISPSWQYVYLENGRTEHHHGLWLDCKRDYSYDYGRTKEYYQTLWRRDLQGSPFDVFYLPPLQCVYKFDYYIDPEDLYDHDHDENRIQNDAYQHLFLGWKIAALAGIGTAVLFSLSTILLGVCSFCHRTFICACTVLSTIAAILSTIGLVVFYMWANYQDNKVIKEDEDTIYEQVLGWAFYAHVIACILFWLSSMMGCCVTSISLSKSRAKLVKIEVVENDEAQLLSSRASGSSSQPFKRSFSAVYRVDSHALRQWEKDYMKNVRQQQVRASQTNLSNFKRTASVPNMSKKQKKMERDRWRQSARLSNDLFSSVSNMTEMTHTGSNPTLERASDPVSTTQPLIQTEPQTPKLKSALKTPKSSRKTLNDTDPTYDYMACPSSMGVSSFLGAGSTKSTTIYDSVYDKVGPDAYLEPNSLKRKNSSSTLQFERDQAKKVLPPTVPPTGSSQSIPVTIQKTTVINDVGRPNSFDDIRNQTTTEKTTRIREQMTYEERMRMENMKKPMLPTTPPPKPPLLPPKPQLTIRDFGIDLSKKSTGYITTIDDSPPKQVNSEIADRLRTLSGRDDCSIKSTNTSPSRNDDDFPAPPSGIAINTFGGDALRRSITNLAYRQPNGSANELFERPDSASSRPEKDRKTPLSRMVFGVMPDEVDRSVGSSAMLENDTISETGSYIRDANVRLNLFMKDSEKKTQDETTV